MDGPFNEKNRLQQKSYLHITSLQKKIIKNVFNFVSFGKLKAISKVYEILYTSLKNKKHSSIQLKIEYHHNVLLNEKIM